jgi:hypothetical protein
MRHKVIGYFSYADDGTVVCDGDACIITSSDALMREYISRMPFSSGRNIIKKTRFGEVLYGLENGAAYAFEEESYRRILPLLKHLGADHLPSPDEFFSAKSPTGLHFIRIQLA